MLRVKLVNPLFLFCLLILFSVADLMSQDFGFYRVEPPFWWVGMKNEDLQLLVYGKNISLTEPRISDGAMTIQRVIKADSPHYLFLDIKISLDAAPGLYPIVFYKDDKQLFEYDFELKMRRSASTFGSSIPVIPLPGSLRKIEGNHSYSIDRNHYCLVQTPQTFQSELIIKAYSQPYRKEFTDDASVYESAGFQVHLIDGISENIKITLSMDLKIANVLIKDFSQ
jgi:hypothetical protein